MLFKFNITSPARQPRTVAIDREQVIFGSASDCDVVLDGEVAPRAFRVFQHHDGDFRIATTQLAARFELNGERVTLERALHPRDVITCGPHRIALVAPDLSPQRRAALVSATTLQKIALRFGDDAAKRYVDDLWSLWADGGPRLKSELFVIEPFAWVEIPNDSTPFDIPSFFWIHNRWVFMAGVDAFRQAIVQAQPDLSEWQPVTRIYAKLVHAEVLITYEEAADYVDPRWHVVTWSPEKLASWEPPHFDGKALRFCVEHHGALECVTIWQDTFSVDVSRRG
jgi:hypothetical protein